VKDSESFTNLVKVSKSFTKLVKVSKSFTNLVKVSESFTKLVKDLVKDLAKDLLLVKDFETTVTWETKKYSQSVVPVFPFLFALDAQVHEGDQLHWTGHNLMKDTVTACGVIVQMHSINIETGSCRSLGDTASEERLESCTLQRWRIVPVDVHFIPTILTSASTLAAFP
jgi:hypothetical protein